MAIRLNSELLIREPIEQNQEAPMPVQEHVGALRNLTETLRQDGRLSPEAAAFSQLFARRHDAGYGTDLALMHTDYANNVLDKAFRAIDSPLSPQHVIDYLHQHADNYLAARVVGHGVLSLVENSWYLQQNHRLSARKALGLASILSAHHPGYPITMVAGFLGEGEVAIPREARSSFFIDFAGYRPDDLRGALADFGADELGVSSRDARRAAVLGYSLDRLTAGSGPDALWLREDGLVGVQGGEVIQKKYGLVAGDLRRDETVSAPSIEQLYATVIERLNTEVSSAFLAARECGEADIQQLVSDGAAHIIGGTSANQADALAILHGLGLSGNFSQLAVERKHLARYAWSTNDQSALYALATYDAVGYDT